MDVNDKIFEFAYIMAFRDSTLRNAFLRRHNEIKDDESFHNRKASIKDHSKVIVHDYIDAIFRAERPDPLVVIKKLCDKHNIDLGFSFGNAQKLVNMTAKYIFLGTYRDAKKRELFEKCHCPMDRKMMVKVREKCKEYGWPMVRWEIPWSQLEAKDQVAMQEYEMFQNYIKRIAEKEGDGDFLIEEDYLLWSE